MLLRRLGRKSEHSSCVLRAVSSQSPIECRESRVVLGCYPERGGEVYGLEGGSYAGSSHQ